MRLHLYIVIIINSLLLRRRTIMIMVRNKRAFGPLFPRVLDTGKYSANSAPLNVAVFAVDTEDWVTMLLI